MKMKRILSLAVAAVMTVGLLAGCGGGSSSSSSGSAAPAASGSAAPAEKVELNVIAAQYGTQTADWWANFVKEFNAANEGINLTVDVVSWNDIYTVVNTRIANGEAPDILNIDVFADYQADDLLLPAKDYVSDETYAKFYESFLDQSVIDGTVWAIPDLASARAMYYNVDILNEVGVEVPTT